MAPNQDQRNNSVRHLRAKKNRRKKKERINCHNFTLNGEYIDEVVKRTLICVFWSLINISFNE